MKPKHLLIAGALLICGGIVGKVYADKSKFEVTGERVWKFNESLQFYYELHKINIEEGTLYIVNKRDSTSTIFISKEPK